MGGREESLLWLRRGRTKCLSARQTGARGVPPVSRVRRDFLFGVPGGVPRRFSRSRAAANRNANRHANRNANLHANRHANRQCKSKMQIGMQIEMQIDMQIEMQIEMQIDMQIEMQIYMQIDMQIDRHRQNNNHHCCPLLAPSPPQPPYHPKGGCIGIYICIYIHRSTLIRGRVATLCKSYNPLNILQKCSEHRFYTCACEYSKKHTTQQKELLKHIAR